MIFWRTLWNGDALAATPADRDERGGASDRIFEQFRRMPFLFPTLEAFLQYGVMCCCRQLLDVMLVPLKLLVAPLRVTVRDALGMFLVMAGLVPYIVTTSSESPMFLYSSAYHTIRGTSILKLYVIFNMLEVAEKLLSSFNHDAVEALWVAVGRLAKTRGEAPSQERLGSAQLLVAWMMIVALGGSAAHSLVLTLQAVTLNVALNSDDYSLFALLISNNFMEIKSYVFKKFSLENLFQNACADVVERVQQLVFMCVMLLRHGQSEGFGTVEPLDLAVILVFEMLVDFVKHFFIARFNRISLSAYSRFLDIALWDAARTGFAGPIGEYLQVGATQSAPVSPEGSTRQATSGRDALAAFVGKYKMPNTFVSNPCRRYGFVPYPYVAVVVWALATPAVNMASSSPVTLAMCICCIVLVRIAVGLCVDGFAARFFVKTGRWAKIATLSTNVRHASKLDDCGVESLGSSAVDSSRRARDPLSIEHSEDEDEAAAKGSHHDPQSRDSRNPRDRSAAVASPSVTPHHSPQTSFVAQSVPPPLGYSLEATAVSFAGDSSPHRNGTTPHGSRRRGPPNAANPKQAVDDLDRLDRIYQFQHYSGGVDK